MESIRIASVRKIDQFSRQGLLQRLKANLRITSADLDGVLVQCLTAAIEDSEAYIGSTIVLSTFTYRTKIDFPSYPHLFTLDLLGPVSPDFAPVATLGEEDVTATLSGRILTITADAPGKLSVTWKAGMEDIPESIAHAIILKASYLFDNPTDTVRERVTAADALLRPFKRFGL